MTGADHSLVFAALLGVSNHLWYGALGGLGAMLITIVGPFLLQLRNSNVQLAVSGRAIAFVLGSIVFYVAVGVLATALLWQNDDVTRDALVYGLGGQATVGGFIQGTRT